MANLAFWRRPSSLSLRRDMEEILSDFDLPRGLRREIERLFDEDLSPRMMWSEIEDLLDEFMPPVSVRRRIARLFEPFVGMGMGMGMGGGHRGRMAWHRGEFAPEIELTERDNAYVLRVDLPGVREQDVDVRVDDDHVLTISGERRREESRRERGYEYTERSYGSFTRSVELPRGADVSKIDADFRNGVLEIHIPKSESARTRQIAIRGREEPRVLESDTGRRDRERISANANVGRS